MKNCKQILVLFFIIFSMVLPNVLIAQNSVNPLQKVRLQLKWKHQFQFAGYYAAIEKGYYRDAGIEVELIEANNLIDPVEVVSEGQAEFGISASDILLSRDKGKKVVLLACILQHSPNVLISARSSGILSGKQLEGKTIALEPDSAEILAFMKEEGIDPYTRRIVPLGYDARQLIDKEVDVVSAYITDEPFLLDQIGFQYNIISPHTNEIDFYSDVLFTTEKFILSDPDLVDRFYHATLKGWKYAMENSYETIDLIYTKYSQRHSREHLKFEMLQMKKLILSDVVEIGYSSPARWQKIAGIYQDLNLISKSFSLKGMLYTDYHKQPVKLPWKLILIFGFVVIVIGLVAYIFYSSSKRLEKEIKEKQLIQDELNDLNVNLELKIDERNSLLIQANTTLQNEIDQRIQMEDLLERSRQNYETFFNSINDFLFVFDGNGKILHVNNTVINSSTRNGERNGCICSPYP
jgi:ABC-type nitrate/sulfonate/bicarbonate transport system substrate-binding protein